MARNRPVRRTGSSTGRDRVAPLLFSGRHRHTTLVIKRWSVLRGRARCRLCAELVRPDPPRPCYRPCLNNRIHSSHTFRPVLETGGGYRHHVLLLSQAVICLPKPSPDQGAGALRFLRSLPRRADQCKRFTRALYSQYRYVIGGGVGYELDPTEPTSGLQGTQNITLCSA